MAIVAPTPDWTMVLTEPIPSAPVVPINPIASIEGALERQFVFNLNRPSTLSFRVPSNAPLAALLMARPDGHIVLRKNGVVRMVADLQTREVAGDANQRTIAITAVETGWSRLPNALIGRSSAGLKGPASATDQGTFLNTTLANYNAEATHHTSISTAGSITASGNITGGVWRYKPLMELIQELSASVAGFDFWFDPVDPTVNANARTATFNVAPLKGTTKAGVVFEFGTAQSNCQSYRFVTDWSNLATWVWVLPPSFPDSGGLEVVQSGHTTRRDAVGYRERVIPSDLNATALRQNIADLAKNVLASPRKVFEVQPAPDDKSGRVPSFPTDFTTGDTIRGRVVERGTTLIDANLRVYGVEVNLDDNGLETDTLTLVSEA